MSNARKLGNMTTHGLDGDFNVDPTDNTLVVDSTNNRVGIGSATPTTTLDITGTATATAFSGPLTGNVTGTTSSISNHDTDALSEGSTNLYYTNARADARAQLKIDALVDSAPGTLDTLNELAAALGDDANFSTTITNSIATKLPLAGGTMTGNVNFGNNDKAIFGTDSSLEIYYDGTDGYIRNHVGGRIITRARTDLLFQTNATGGGADDAMKLLQNGAVELYWDNYKKFETTSTGITVTSDGIGIKLDGTANTSRKIFFRSTTNANKAEIYADGGLKIWTDDAGSDLLLAPAGSLHMSTMPTITIDANTEYSTTEDSELNPVATDALYLHNEENSSTYGKVSIHMRSSGGGGAASARMTLKNNRSGSSALGFFMRDNNHTGEQKEKMYLDSDANLSLTGTAAVVITATPGTTSGNNSAIALGRTDGSNTIQMNTALAVDVAIPGTAGVTVGSTNSATPATRLRSANSSNGHIVISPKGSEKVRIKATGEVGIQVVGEDPRNKLSLGHPHESPSDTDRILNWYDAGSELHNSNIYQAIVMDSNNTSQPGQIGIALANKNMQVGSWSPAITFGGRSQAGSGDYMNGGAAIASKNFTGSNDGNFIDSELHFFTKGSHTGAERNLSSKMKITGQGTVSITNGDLGHTHFTDKQGRYLTSNGAGWTSSTDGTDPGLVVSQYHTGTEVKNLGIVLHNDTSTAGAKSPTISFGAVSASTAYNTTYAHIVGNRRGTGPDTNWASGDLEFYTQPDEGYTRMPNMTVHHGGQVSGSMNGRNFGLSNNNWLTFGTLYGAQGTPLHIKVMAGHNSYGGYNEFTNDTYAYNIAAGTVVTIGNTSGSYTAQLRKIKRVGGVGYSSGDGGWEYQIARNQAYGFSVHMQVMGATSAWRWQI